MSTYPVKLSEILELFRDRSESERREMLAAFADEAGHHAPAAGEPFDLTDIRQDEICTDEVGIFLRVDAAGQAHFKVRLGPQVQTLTRALAVILCRGLEGSSLESISTLTPSFIEDIVGERLILLRSQTVYYVLHRMQEAASTYQSGEES